MSETFSNQILSDSGIGIDVADEQLTDESFVVVEEHAIVRSSFIVSRQLLERATQVTIPLGQYKVIGWPGGNKTVKLIKTILQVYDCYINARILILSSSSIDFLVQLIKKSGSTARFNIYPFVASSEQEEGQFEQDSFKVTKENLKEIKADIFQENRIIATTCNSANDLKELGIKFDFIFVDETNVDYDVETLCELMNEDPVMIVPL